MHMRAMTVSQEAKDIALKAVRRELPKFEAEYWGVLLTDDECDEYNRIYVVGYHEDKFKPLSFIVVACKYFQYIHSIARLDYDHANSSHGN
jgi:hypothetical protein